MGTQPRDLLIAWLSFLAGDFCEEDRTNRVPVTLSIVFTVIESEILGTVLSCFRGNIYITRSTVCLLCQKCGSAVVCAYSVSACVCYFRCSSGGCGAVIQSLKTALQSGNYAALTSYGAQDREVKVSHAYNM